MKHIQKYKAQQNATPPTPLYQVDDYILLKDDPKYHWSGIDLRCKIYKISIVAGSRTIYYYLTTYLKKESNAFWDKDKLYGEYDLTFNHEETIERKLTPKEIIKYKKDITIYNQKRELLLAAQKYNL